MPLGRTNQDFPRIWLRPAVPTSVESLEEFSERLSGHEPVDVSSSPALWGRALRQAPNPVLVRVGRTLERTVDANHATDTLQAELIERLSSLGRTTLDIIALEIHRPLEEFQIDGALRAMELARQEGFIRFFGLWAAASAMTIRGVWQFHDAFELLFVRRNHVEHAAFDALSPFARDRRVGIVTFDALQWYGPEDITQSGPWRLRNLTRSFYGLGVDQAIYATQCAEHPVLARVDSLESLERARQSVGLPVPEGLAVLLDEFREAAVDAQ